MSEHGLSSGLRASTGREPLPSGVPPRSSVTRRQFLRRAAVAGSLAAAPYVVPASVLGRAKAAAPASGSYSAGSGSAAWLGDLRWMIAEKDVQFVAVCDAKKSQREKVKKTVDGHYGNTDCATYATSASFSTLAATSTPC